MNSNNVMQDLIKSMMPKVVDGKMEDQHGNDIKVANIKPHEMDSHDLVCKAIASCSVMSDQISDLRASLDEQFEQHIEALFERYDKKLGGKKGNVSLFSYDRKFKLERSKQDVETTNEHILITLQLVDACLENWSKGANKNLTTFVRKYFRTDAKGNYNVKDLKRVRNLELPHPDPDWETAMEALDNSIVFDSTATYFRAFYRDEDGNYIQIPLDIAKVNAVRPQQQVTEETV